MKFSIAPPDSTLEAPLQRKIDGKTKPLGSLGRLEPLALQIGLVQQTLTPQLRQPHFLVFAGDHGAARAGVSAYPQEVTWQMVDNYLTGGAAINVFCAQSGIALTVVDAGVNHDFGGRPDMIHAKIANGTENYLEAPAMTAEQCRAALEKGRELVHELSAEGCNCVGFGEMGIGNTASASLLTHCLISRAAHTVLVDVVGRGTGLDDAGLSRKCTLLSQALARGGMPHDPVALLAEYGGFEIAMMTGAILGAAEKRMLILVDGFIVTSAVLVAHAIAPAVLSCCIFTHCSQEPGHRLQLDYLRADPLMQLDLRLGEGTGAALAYPLVRAAAGFLNDMASFESANVSVRS